MKTVMLGSLFLLLAMTATHAGQAADCAEASRFFSTLNPIVVGSSTAVCAHVTNCGEHQRRFDVEFADARPDGDSISIGTAVLSLDAGQTLIVCATYPNVQQAGLHDLTINVSSRNKLLASGTTELIVN